ncbi:hypothetical protein CDAR_391421 [Caerostris darwini]|uniref:Uncharacterized protein n=1 Tax=Caerostris darwini TaxID=1538125 RepID=A0AAV4WAG3_9ARAC|nr:hypothetical protein CDAR_391421 [Caerostris darwini]
MNIRNHFQDFYICPVFYIYWKLFTTVPELQSAFEPAKNHKHKPIMAMKAITVIFMINEFYHTFQKHEFFSTMDKVLEMSRKKYIHRQRTAVKELEAISIALCYL